MNWLQRYRVRHYLRNSMWVWPVVALVAALVLVRLLHAFETSLNLEAKIDPDTARAVLGALAGAMFTFIVFVCSSLLLVVQLASAQLTPRVIATMFRDRVTKLTMSLFVFNFTFTLSALLRINDSVPLLITEMSGYGCAASIGVFLYLIDHVGKMLRPSGVFEAVASEAHGVIKIVYPRRLSDAWDSAAGPDAGAPPPPAVTVRSGTSGVVLAFDQKGLVVLATRHDCLIEMAPQVGDFVAPGDALFHIYGTSADLSASLAHSIALGAERTVEQDPAFAFRVIVDIAAKGLSPAINDPTTAVLAIDRLHHLLRHVGGRRLDNERIRDANGRLRLMVRTPDWEDFVKLAITEIRHFGGSSIQIARRLRAMLEDLIAALPEARAVPLRSELALLKKSAERFFQEPEDRTLAEKSDAQGVGGIRIVGRPRSESAASGTNH
jgi:uncharacterized membrane protein